MGWLEFVNEETRDRLHRLRVMTDPRDVRRFLIHRLESRFDFPLRTELTCVVEDVHEDGSGLRLDLVPVDLAPDGYEVLGPIPVRTDRSWMPGSVVRIELVLSTTDDRLVGEAETVEPYLAVTT